MNVDLLENQKTIKRLKESSIEGQSSFLKVLKVGVGFANESTGI